MIKKFKSEITLNLVKLIVIIQILIVTYRPLSLNRKDIIESYSAITVDGFDFIVTGRALASGIFSNWPVLRNPLFTAISTLDSVLGGIGIAFSIFIGFALALQFYTISKILKHFQINSIMSASLFIVFFMNNIHFIDVYILSDAISLSLMLYGISLIITKEDQEKELLGGLIIITSSLGQFYTLFGLLFMFLPNNFSLKDLINKFKQKASIVLIIYIIFTFLFRKFWTSLISHDSVPVNFSLLKFNLNMFNFYLNTWSVIFIPFIIVFIYLLIMNIKFPHVLLKEYFTNTGIYITIIVGLFIFFYQWKESRFSYLLFIFVLINLILIVSKTINSKQTQSALILLAIFTIVFNVIWTPRDNWQPRAGESRFFRPWVTERYWERVPFSLYVELRDMKCSTDSKTNSNQEISSVIESQIGKLWLNPNTVKFGIKNCL